MSDIIGSYEKAEDFSRSKACCCAHHQRCADEQPNAKEGRTFMIDGGRDDQDQQLKGNRHERRDDAQLNPVVNEAGGDADSRSEENTSELQSLMRISYAVFCLKKKIHTKDKQIKSQK